LLRKIPLGEPLRALCALASGYPLHQPLQPYGLSCLVPLLSLSLPTASRSA
jgi:hypothetical protein